MADFDLSRAVLDSLPEGVAVLDLLGRIIAANSSWNRGVSDRGDSLARGVAGEDYLSLLGGVHSTLYNEASEVAKGIRSVLEGGLSYFEIDYPCGAPPWQRWFRLRVQPFKVEDKLEGALLSNLDITERKLAEIELTRKTEELTGVERSLKESLALLSKKIRFEAIIGEVARRVHKSLDLSEVLRQTVSAVKDNVEEAEFVAVYMVEGDEAVLKAQVGCPDWYIRRVARIPSPKGYTWKTIREGKTVYCSDTDEDNVIGPAALDLGIKSYISVPITDARGATIGCFNVNSTRKGAFDEDTLNVLEIVAHQIEIAIENAQRAEALRRSEEALRKNVVQLSKKSRLDSILTAIMSSVHSTIDLEQVLQNTVSAIHENLDSAEHVAVFLVQGKEAVMMAQRGYPAWYESRIRRIPSPKGHTWWTIIEGKPRVCLDVDKDDVIGPAGRELGIGSYVSVPLFFGSSAIGCINITSMSKNAFDEDEVHLLEIVAKQIEVAISNAKQAEALQESEEKFRVAFESSPDVIMVIDLTSDNILSVNPSIERVLGYDPRFIVGKHLSTIHADYASLKNKILTAALNGSGVLYITIDLEKADGSLCPVEISSAMIPWGGARAALVNFRDITARMRAEEQITKQAALLDSTSDAVFVLDLDGKVVFWNKRAESVYGWSREEILGENLVARVISQSGEKENIHKILMERGEWRGELSQVGRDGKEIIVESRMTLVRGRDGNPESILVINTDVTESKRLHEQFLRAQRLESIGTLAGGIAHDLNNVLQPIMLSLDLLRRRIHDEKGLRLVETLSDSAKRAASLVNQVLLFSRGQKLERKDLRLGDLIGEIRDFLSETLPKSIEIRTNLSDDLFIVSGDPTQLHQVIMNLCVNARDAMPEGGLLEISARNAFVDEYYASLLGNATAGNYVVLSVSDTGCGMSKEVMDRIFEPFFTTKAPGTGLGLPTSLRIVKDHGGFIHVYSEEGKGSQFKVYLPAAVGKEGGHLEGYEEGGELSGDGETILVVDDEENIRDLTREILEAHGYRVLLAKDGVEGVGTYTEHGDEISVVIVDMVMPVLGGSSAIKAISSVNPEVKIIATSGMQHSMEIVDESGPVVKAFLFKPFTAPTLLKTLRSVLKENS